MEQNGSLLDEVETVLNFAKIITWQGKHSTITLVDQTYFAKADKNATSQTCPNSSPLN